MAHKKFSGLIVLLAILIIPLSAQFHVLHFFAGGATDGSLPDNTLILDGSVLYGMTTYGGASDKGVVFKVNTNGSGFSLLHTFIGGKFDGAYPLGALTLSGSTLFGTTNGGGGADGGTVFKIDTDGTDFAIVHSFLTGADDGAVPSYSALVIVGGTLYGTTPYGGAGDFGVIYKVDTDGTDFSLLHTFAGGPTDGSRPFGALILDGSTLYGMTVLGGANGMGMIYKFDSNTSTFGLVYSFAGGTTGGAYPGYGKLAISGSTLYGMTQAGGSTEPSHGVVFSIGTSGTGFTVLHSFVSGTADGYDPRGSLALSGSTLYGMTPSGGSGGGGTLFRLGADGSDYSILHAFAGGASDGSIPYCDVIVSGSMLYGMTRKGGPDDLGTLFMYSTAPSADVSIIKNAGNLTPVPNTDVSFTISTSNDGPGDATGVKVTDLLPASLTYKSSSTVSGTYNRTTGVWDIGPIAADETAVLSITATVNSSGTITNTATKTAQNEADSDATNDSDSVTLVTVPQKLLLPPILLTPLNNATGQPTTVTLKWQDTNNTPQEVKYKVRIKKAGGAYANFLVNANVVQYIKSGLSLGKVYYWNVQALGNGTSTKTSAWANGGVDFKFTVAPPVTLIAPVLMSPGNLATDIPLSIQLQWQDTNSSPQELKYKVRFKVAGGAYTYSPLLNPGTTTFTKSGLAKNKTYYWSVQAIGNGTSILSSAWPTDWKFTTIK